MKCKKRSVDFLTHTQQFKQQQRLATKIEEIGKKMLKEFEEKNV